MAHGPSAHPLFASGAFKQRATHLSEHWTQAVRVLLPDSNRAASAARRAELWRWMGGSATNGRLPLRAVQQFIEEMVMNHFAHEREGKERHRMLLFLRAGLRAAADAVLEGTSDAFQVELSREAGCSFGLGIAVESERGYPHVSYLQQGSVAADCKRIDIGDRVVTVNGRAVASEEDFRGLLPSEQLVACVQLRRGSDLTDLRTFRLLSMRLHQYLDVYALLHSELYEPWSPISFDSFCHLLHERRHKNVDKAGQLLSLEQGFHLVRHADGGPHGSSVDGRSLGTVSFDTLARWSIRSQLVRPGSGALIPQMRMPTHWVAADSVGLYGFADSPRGRRPPPPPQPKTALMESPLASAPQEPNHPLPRPERARRGREEPSAYPGPAPFPSHNEVAPEPFPFPMFALWYNVCDPEPEPLPPRPLIGHLTMENVAPPKPRPPAAPPPDAPAPRRPPPRQTQMGLGIDKWGASGAFAALSARDQKVVNALPTRPKSAHHSARPAENLDVARPSQSQLHRWVLAVRQHTRKEDKERALHEAALEDHKEMQRVARLHQERAKAAAEVAAREAAAAWSLRVHAARQP